MGGKQCFQNVFPWLQQNLNWWDAGLILAHSQLFNLIGCCKIANDCDWLLPSKQYAHEWDRVQERLRPCIMRAGRTMLQPDWLGSVNHEMQAWECIKETYNYYPKIFFLYICIYNIYNFIFGVMLITNQKNSILFPLHPSTTMTRADENTSLYTGEVM